jgi:hypothetical protein
MFLKKRFWHFSKYVLSIFGHVTSILLVKCLTVRPLADQRTIIHIPVEKKFNASLFLAQLKHISTKRLR